MSRIYYAIRHRKTGFWYEFTFSNYLQAVKYCNLLNILSNGEDWHIVICRECWD